MSLLSKLFSPRQPSYIRGALQGFFGRQQQQQQQQQQEMSKQQHAQTGHPTTQAVANEAPSIPFRKWDKLVHERSLCIPRGGITSQSQAEDRIGRLLFEDSRRGEVDEHGLSLNDHVNFFLVVYTILLRLNQWMFFVFGNACDDSNLDIMDAMHLVTRICPHIPTYVELVRGYPAAAKLDQGGGAGVARGRKLVMSDGLMELVRLEGEKFEQWSREVAEEEIPEEPVYVPPEKNEIVTMIPEPVPEVVEFVRDLIAVTEEGILGGREDLRAGVRLVVDEWLDYLWLFNDSRRLTPISKLAKKAGFCTEDDIHVSGPLMVFGGRCCSIDHAKESLASAEKVANSGGLAKWGLMELYEFEIIHASSMVKDAERVMLQAKQGSGPRGDSRPSTAFNWRRPYGRPD